MTNNRQLVSLYYQKWSLAVCFPKANKEAKLVERMLSSGGRGRGRQKSVQRSNLSTGNQGTRAFIDR